MPYQAASAVAFGLEEVAIALAPGVLGSHLGVAFRKEDGEAVVMDLGFHRLLRVEPYPGKPNQWSAAVVPLPAPLASQVVSLLRVFAEKFQRTGQPKPDYGINLKMTGGSIGPDGEYTPAKGSDGHTCSTFVAEAFRAARVQLVELSTWPETEENKAWGTAIVCMLYQYAKHKPQSQAFGHAKIVEKNNAGARLLPEEVAAAGQLPIAQLPSPHAALVAPAQAAHAQMRAVCVDEGPGMFAKCVDEYRKKLSAIQAKAAAASQAAAQQPAAQQPAAQKPAAQPPPT